MFRAWVSLLIGVLTVHWLQTFKLSEIRSRLLLRTATIQGGKGSNTRHKVMQVCMTMLCSLRLSPVTV